MPQNPVPAIGADVSNLMPAVGDDVSHLMGDDAAAQPARAWYSPITDLVSQLESLKVWKIPGALADAATHPAQTMQAVGQQNAQLFTKAEDAFKKGDYATGTRHAINYVLNGIPGVGARLDQAGDDFAKGDYAKGTGKTLDVAASTIGPKVLANAIGGARVPPVAGNPNAVEAAAVASLDKGGVPVSAGAASGNRFIRGVQELADTSPAGALVAERAKAAQGRGLATMGEQLAQKANPTAVTAEQAGQGVRNAVYGKVQQFAGEADTAYDAVRKVEADPRSVRNVQVGTTTDAKTGAVTPVMADVALPVDLRAVKAALKPIYERMARQMPVTQQQASRGMKALENIVNGPDAASLTQVDADLGAIKTIARTDIPELRNVSQGLAANAVQQLDHAVQSTAQQAGVLDALKAGRKATTAKYIAGDLLDAIRAEPVGAFRQATSPADSGIAQLREIATHAPAEMPRVARAVIDGLLERATTEGGFSHTDRLYADWQRLGPATKAMLFKDPDYIKALDQFFLGAKALLKPENTSKSALVAHSGAQAALVFTNPATGVPLVIGSGLLSKFLHSSTGVRLLTRGFTLPSQATAARAAYGAQLSRAIAEFENSPGLVPATTDGSPESKR